MLCLYTKGVLENLKERKSPVKTEKENYEYCPSLIGWSLTILVLMAGTILQLK